jgi:tetratricopeptide (TPR) repeat protein
MGWPPPDADPKTRMIVANPRLRWLIVLALLGVIGWSVYRLGGHFWATHQLAAARDAAARGDHAAARDHLLQCLAVRPDHPDAHFWLARTARRAGDSAEAREQLRQCERAGGVPELIQLERTLAVVEAGDAAPAEAVLWAFVENDHPDAAYILEALGKGYGRLFRLREAREAIDRWIERQPENAEAYLLRGRVTYHMRGYKEAQEFYRKAAELAPDNEEARRLYAELLLENNQLAGALDEFDRYGRDHPGAAWALIGRARTLLAQGHGDAAAAAADAALAADPTSVEALVARGKADLHSGRPERALRWLERATELAPYDRPAAYSLGQCLQQLGRRDEAKKWNDRFRDIEQDQARLSKITKKLLNVPRDAGLRYEAGAVFLRIGNEPEGLRWLESALREDPRHVPTHRLLADHYRKHGRPDLAQAHDAAVATP